MRCYAPSMSAIAAMVFAGYLALRHVTGHVLASASLLTAIVIALGVAGVAAGAIVVSAATIRRRRAVAGGCHTCSHSCREEMVRMPQWPHRPLTRAPLPVVAIPRQRPADGAGQPAVVTAARVGTADR